MFQPDDVVVCVDDQPQNPSQKPLIKAGSYYRINSVGLTPLKRRQAVDIGAREASGAIAWYVNSRFRKIDDEVTEEFREMVRNLKQPKPVINPARHRVEAK